MSVGLTLMKMHVMPSMSFLSCSYSIIFLLDIETVFLLPWAASLSQLPTIGYWSIIDFLFELITGFISSSIPREHLLFIARRDRGHDRLCRRGVGRVFLAGVRPDSPSRRRIPSCYRPGPGRGVVVELGQRGVY